MPEEHAGGKWSLRYERSPGQTGNLEVDINYMFRVPLWPVMTCDSHPVGAWRAKGIPVLDHHELAAGNLAALLARRQVRDLFDSHRILQMEDLDPQRLRIGFVVYGAMNSKDWRTVSAVDERQGMPEPKNNRPGHDDRFVRNVGLVSIGAARHDRGRAGVIDDDTRGNNARPKIAGGLIPGTGCYRETLSQPTLSRMPLSSGCQLYPTGSRSAEVFPSAL